LTKLNTLPERPRLLFINRSYWPDVEATGQLLTELCEDLADEFDVHVLCGQPQRVAEGSDFKAFGTSCRNGVTIHRTRHTRFHKSSFVGRLANMLTFQAASCWRAFRVPPPDVVITETDPPFLCLLGWALKRLRRCRLICYLQDIYPDVAVALGQLWPGLFTNTLRRLFFAAYRRSDAVIVLSRDMHKRMLTGGLAADRLHVIPNWVDLTEIHPVKADNPFRQEHALVGKFVVMYSGNMGLSQRLQQVLAAAELLGDRSDIAFMFVGDGADRTNLERFAAEKRLSHVRFVDYQPKSRLAESLSAADVHLVILRPEVKELLMPSKLYGVLASGTPALVLADVDCELAVAVTMHDLGLVVADDSAEALADAVRRYADSRDVVDRRARAARQFAESYCGRDRSIELFRKVLWRPEKQPSPLSSETPALAAGI
jgi:glycosyltransferase involved in cell wall biosynthesis